MNEQATREPSPGCSGRWLPAILLLIHAALLAWGAWRHTPTPDEIASIPAGIKHWKYEQFDLYRVNPPLIRMVATLPLLPADPQIDLSRANDRPGKRVEYAMGAEFIRQHRDRAFWLFTLARWACVPFSLVGGLVCYLWARELYGRLAGCLALTLWCFAPNILAHGQLITTDVGATALGVAAFYCFWRWLKGPNWRQTVATGLVLGLAELTKSTWVVLFLFWPLLWLTWLLSYSGKLQRGLFVDQAVKLLVILVVALGLLNLGYGCEGSFRRLDSYRFTSALLSGSEVRYGNRFADSWVGSLPVPLPANYLQGIDRQKADLEPGRWKSYLRLQWRDRGWWYYYLYGLAVKVPLGTWMLVLLAGAVRFTGRRGHRPWRDELLLLLPLVVMLVFVSSQTGFSQHLRYALPILPFAFMLISQVAGTVALRRRVIAVLAGLALTWSVTSSLWIYPHVLSYFSELVGGPRQGHAHLLHSNIDWGQDFHYLRRWINKHPEAAPIGFAHYSPFVDPQALGLEYTEVAGAPLPGERRTLAQLMEIGPQPGWYAVGVSALRGESRRHAFFLLSKPVATVGYSIYVYHLSLDEANRVRRELNLPELPEE